jgi:uncharacterized circularly permuted ATP-grasp superfamily protein/uncharacterized alpha-E superfamily protein
VNEGETHPAGSIFDGYTPPKGVYDEVFVDDRTMRPHWQQFMEMIERLGARELTRRWEQADRLIRENGMTYNAYGEPDDVARPWNLDVLPLMIDAEQWRELSAGLVQRARLLNEILLDIYGPQRLLTDGLLPADLIFSHPGFMRPVHGQRLRDHCFLHFYAVDLARAPDGQWWVMGDRTDAPLGVGYALENRIVVSRMFPEVIRRCNVERLAPFFITLRDTLRRLASEHRENPRIVLLSQGPTNPNYFEDAYLARYLGYTLAEGGDLAVRDDRVFLKTLGGLLPVDVIFRRLGDQNCDPLELRGDPALGVPGLLQAVRSGHVAIANALGSSLVESSALMPYLPGLCRQLLGEELLLPSVATWWCGDSGACNYVLSDLDRLTIRSAYRVDRREPVPAEQLRTQAHDELARQVLQSPSSFVGREEVIRSSAPVWGQRAAPQPMRVALRAFIVASGKSFVALPGGLVRVSPVPSQLDYSILAGLGSKDVWVQGDEPVREVSLLSPASQPMELRRGSAELPSRVADNVFWLGRRIERAEGVARLLRAVLSRLSGESYGESLPEVPTLLYCLAAQGQIEPGFAVEGMKEQLPSVEHVLPEAVLNEEHADSLRSIISSLYRNASLVRDRISLDSWRIIHHVEGQFEALAAQPHSRPSDLLNLLNRVIIDLAALDGLVVESMTRAQAWRFWDLGRRVERALYTITLIRSTLAKGGDSGEGAVLEGVLEVADSIMTYRSRYLANVQLPLVLDLLLTDETNPRSVGFQLAAIADHVENLPRDRAQPLRGAEQRIAMSALHAIRMLDAELLCKKREPGRQLPVDQLLIRLADQLPKLSRLISHKYLFHADSPRQLAR